VITPSWTWHDHGNDGSDPLIWLDGLDVPIVNLFKTSFSEGGAAKAMSAGPPPGDCEARYAGGLPRGKAPQRKCPPRRVGSRRRS